ncbi:hypothetical protein BOTCAL_0031g00370 [Botryotinia calthae]|uniref:Alpha/beta hydrolase fold-3 domain-containing protein n=1 Tax=Botryotinia calthae TaxID=38488 RepID=A0A4Y8DDH2_9HELO|nr:hypothetical protein BOTCAL_0031g00370 [Botryotinia calthae]
MGDSSGADYKPEWLELEKALGTRPLLAGDSANIKEQFNSLIAALNAQRPPPDSSVQTRDASADGVPVRIYTPSNASQNGNFPLGVYFHGGGYCVGSLDSEDAWCRYIAKSVPCVLIGLGPKYKVPTMLDDSVKAFEWSYKHASELHASQSQLFTIGGSAGGGLALTVAHDLIAAGKRSHIKGIVAMVPVAAHPSSIPASYKNHYKSYDENAHDVPHYRFRYAEYIFWGLVTLSNHLDEFPPTYIATCGKDPLRDDGKVLEMMLKDKGIKTKSDYYDGVPHYFWLFPGIKGGDEFLDNVSKGVKFVLGI